MGMIGVTQISTITITKLTVTSTLNSPITYRTAILIGEQGVGSLVLQNSTITSTVTNGALTYLQACGPGIVVGITDGIGNSISIQNVVANINMAFNDWSYCFKFLWIEHIDLYSNKFHHEHLNGVHWSSVSE